MPCETGVGDLRINDMRAGSPVATGTSYHVMSFDITQCHDRTVPKLSQRTASTLQRHCGRSTAAIRASNSFHSSGHPVAATRCEIYARQRPFTRAPPLTPSHHARLGASPSCRWPDSVKSTRNSYSSRTNPSASASDFAIFSSLEWSLVTAKPSPCDASWRPPVNGLDDSSPCTATCLWLSRCS